MDLRELYQDIILDHARSPRNFHAMVDANHLAHGHNPLCGDKLTVFMKIQDEVIEEISFEGRGCAISTASASLMTEILTGKSVAQADAVFAAFHTRVTTGEVIEIPVDLEEASERLEPLTGVRTYPARVKCATLAWHTVDAAVKGGVIGAIVKTE